MIEMISTLITGPLRIIHQAEKWWLHRASSSYLFGPVALTTCGLQKPPTFEVGLALFNWEQPKYKGGKLSETWYMRDKTWQDVVRSPTG